MNVRGALRLLVPLAAVAGVLLATSEAQQAATAVKKCPTNRATLIVNGVRSCVPTARLRQRAVTTTVTSSLLESALTGPTMAPRLKNGRRARPAIPPALTRSLLRAYPGAEARLLDAGRQSLTRSQTARTRTTQKAVSVTVSEPTVSIINGAAKATGSITASEGGASATMEVGVTVKGDGGFDLDFGFSGTAPDGSRSSAGVTMREKGDSSAPTCPTATGEIPAKSGYNVTKRGSETFAAGGVTLGTAREAITGTSSAEAKGQMSPEARLLPFRFTVSAGLDYSKSAQGLAFLQSRQRAVGRGTFTGTMNPVSGDVSGATRSITVRASGFDGGAAAPEAELRRLLEKALNNQAGRLREELQGVEKRARAGECTKIIFNPASGAELNPNDKQSVRARLETVVNPTTVPQARWTASAQKGSVTPADSKAPEPTLEVTAASKGPETANIAVEATSPAGISKSTWAAKEKGLPARFSGTVNVQNVQVDSQRTTWTSVVTYTLADNTLNANGVRNARYTLTSANVTAFEDRVGNPCFNRAAGTGGTIRFGDLEIMITAAGAVSYAFVHDVGVGILSYAPEGPVPPCGPTFTNLGVAFINARTRTSALRPVGSDLKLSQPPTDDLSENALPGRTSTASWELLPS